MLHRFLFPWELEQFFLQLILRLPFPLYPICMTSDAMLPAKENKATQLTSDAKGHAVIFYQRNIKRAVNPCTTARRHVDLTDFCKSIYSSVSLLGCKGDQKLHIMNNYDANPVSWRDQNGHRLTCPPCVFTKLMLCLPHSLSPRMLLEAFASYVAVPTLSVLCMLPLNKLTKAQAFNMFSVLCLDCIAAYRSSMLGMSFKTHLWSTSCCLVGWRLNWYIVPSTREMLFYAIVWHISSYQLNSLFIHTNYNVSLKFQFQRCDSIRFAAGTKQCQKLLRKERTLPPLWRICFIHRHACAGGWSQSPANVEFPWTLTTEQLNSFEH